MCPGAGFTNELTQTFIDFVTFKSKMCQNVRILNEQKRKEKKRKEKKRKENIVNVFLPMYIKERETVLWQNEIKLVIDCSKYKQE